jgi:hypothetical protein
MKLLSHRHCVRLATLVALALLPAVASAITVSGTVEPTTPLGQYMSMKMTVNDNTTTFELTGPDYSWFAFGFDTTTMQGYSIIVEGTDANRTAHERNLLGIGNPGSPQTTQNLNIVSTTHDAANDLSKIIITRANSTGDANDPNFGPSLTPLDVIWAYSSFASPAFPNPTLSFHGSNGRGTTQITFAPVPEPTSFILSGIAAGLALSMRRRRTQLRRSK